MTEQQPAKAKRGRPRKETASKQAQELFDTENYIPVEKRAIVTDHDVDDLFADIDDTDLRTGKELARESHMIDQDSPYAKRDGDTAVRLEDSDAKPANTTPQVNNPGSPKVEGQTLDQMVRAEEIAAELVKTQGRFIEGVDNARVGVPFRAVESDIAPADMPIPFADQPNVRSDGVVLDNVGVLDTGAGSQTSQLRERLAQRDDPSSPNFMVCVNRNCRYRENCVRYRMHNKRDLKTVFYPEDCRRDGIYIDLDDTEFTAYDPMSVIESSSTPSF